MANRFDEPCRNPYCNVGTGIYVPIVTYERMYALVHLAAYLDSKAANGDEWASYFADYVMSEVYDIEFLLDEISHDNDYGEELDEYYAYKHIGNPENWA